MTTPPALRKPETALQKEIRIFGEQVRRLFNCLLNKTFDLTVKGSQRRNRMLMVAFLALGFFISLRSHPLSAWREEFGHLMQYLLNPAYAQAAPNTPAIFVNFVLGTFFTPQTLRYLPVFVLPFLFALQSAAIYLADIFELKQVSIARDFIMQVALTGNHKHIRIGGGEVAEEHKDSPIYLIGGPGKVLVELDSVALFERPDGRPHVIGPTVKGKATLEGFERFRQALDLRDQYTDPQDPLDVKSRSLDGIPISAKDVRLVFSIWREGKPPTAESPHPFSEEAVKALVYDQSSKVVIDGPHPSELPASWTGAIQGLIRGELGGFMSKHKLVEYLSSIGLPETQQAKQREEEIAAIGRAVIPEDDSPEPRTVPPPPTFKPRHMVSSLFSQFAQGFTGKASKRGVELHWIGVGTWKTPSEIVPDKHLEAWRLSRENLARGSQEAMKDLRQEAHLQQTLRLIQKIPLERFQQNSGRDHKDIVQDILIGYREQLIETIELLRKSRKPIPSSLPSAIKYIETILGIKHWVGAAGPSSGPAAAGVGSPPPALRSRPGRPRTGSSTGVPSSPAISPEEEDLYRDLLTKARGDTEQAERLIAYEQKRAPHADRIECLRRAIQRWNMDNR
jgi:hypothetical protein